MKKRALYHFFATATAIFLLVLTVNCSKNDEQQQDEKGRVEKITDQAAETAVKKIRTPMDKARATQNLGDDRLEEMDKAVQKQ
jgi:large-conductance mechanosensitive channel